MGREEFKHKSQLRVRNYEVDWQGIVHNANYLLYFEVGRIEYLKSMGVKIAYSTMTGDSRVVLVRNEINYKSPAKFDELINIYTRVSYIKNTSFAFEAFMEEDSTGRLVAENIAVHVWLEPKTGEPTPVKEDFKGKIHQFEGEHVAISRPTLYT